ncbi:hypothetical protein SYNPS1DRAFT_30640 [Syncephalis pseudoplumigaleata]|uniref:Uncharacterized protein n=1 Tax=Syncephalis pseudoplumigaleata TaxID=1712513 RepID=A0A4P9YUA5_9FUNG|nr:hypothetical protein SYNPS1DRAFT_30640 [Syncephalis pseudoplumigaleata]|eukprot:RKP23603.1 hypothetical protein SYNPS1DRAFT_30640 [Syncephalis pseudoplumigaleata]
MRDKLTNPPMEYFGNVINKVLFTATAGDIVDRPLGRMAAMHRQEILASRAHTMEQWLMQSDITSKTSLAERIVIRLPYVDYSATDWSKFKCYTVDFGEGCPTFLRHSTYVQKHIICILDRPCAPDGSSTGYDVSISVDETSYDRFCNDNELLAYGTIIG